MLNGMPEKDRRSTARRFDDFPRKMEIATEAPLRPSTTLWRMRSKTWDQASCSVTEDASGWRVVVVFTRGLGVLEHFDHVEAAMRHSMEIAGRLAAQGWAELDLKDDAA